MGLLSKVAKGAGVFLGGTLPKQTENKQDYQIETTSQEEDIRNQVNSFNNQNNENLQLTKQSASEAQAKADATDDDLKRDYEEKQKH